ncbi:hypothetical protein Tco_0289288 [Tanacetum coccineum]
MNRHHMNCCEQSEDSMSPPPLAPKPKKGKSQTVTPTLPKSQGPEASGALSKEKNSLSPKSHPLRPRVTWGQRLRGNIPPTDMEPIHTPVTDPLGTGAKYQVDKTQSTRLRYRSLTKNEGKTSSEVEPDTKPLQLQTYADIQAFMLSIDKLVEASMSSLDRSSTTISDLYKGLNVITQILKDINNAVKDDHAAHSLKQEEASAAWTKSSTNMAWNLGSRMTAIEISQTALKSEVSSLRHDTFSQSTPRIDKGKGIGTESDEDPSKRLVPASTIIRPDPDEPEKMKKSAEEAKLLAMSRPEVIKVVQEKAEKIGLDLRKIASAKAD